MPLEIIYQDLGLIAINKPHGLLVHRTGIAADATTFALQLLRDQTAQHVYPAHRLDRKTSGVLLFSLNEQLNKEVQQLFANRKVAKNYLAIVRGYTDDRGEINYALKKDNGKIQEAITAYETLQRTEIQVAFGKYQTSRYSLVRAMPQTGRMHQIRKHFAHILHPIIGDRPYGCNKQNRLFLEKWNMGNLLLHASSLEFTHPENQTPIYIFTKPQSEFSKIADILGFNMEKYSF